MKKLFTVFLLLVSGQSMAGYFATLTERPAGSPYCRAAVGVPSGCYLTVSMAIQAVMGSCVTNQVTAINVSPPTFTGTSPSYYPASGSWGECTASPLGGVMPSLAGGVSDPAIVSGSIISGGSGSSSGGGVFLTNAADAEIVLAAFLTMLAIAGGIRLIKSSIATGDHISDEKH